MEREDGFTTESSTDSITVTIDGREYTREPGVCFVALDTGTKYTSQRLTVPGNATLEELKQVSLAIELPQFKQLIDPLERAEPSDAPKDRASRIDNGKSTSGPR
ncbi:hypothetical protein Poly59_30130 [Rubripirellula reticaptiva]|uniref:Uncharacterized protein n=1 Tax=Rubripirellula reticaptiva TaxID=2528013 RepID=A0A5C6EW21_9BACT|nr:hypothetical protein Poly59_30130 [Rubripirellula reticaptiva]